MNRASRALVVAVLLGCSSSGGAPGHQSPSLGGAGFSTAGSAGLGGAGGVPSAPMPAGGVAGAAGGASSGSAVGGAAVVVAGAGSSNAGAGGAGGSADGAAFVCSQVQGLTLTREWYLAGFEEGDLNARWQLKAAQSAYVNEWADDSSPFWATPIDSPCELGSSAPDRVVFVVLSWTIMAQADWESAIAGAVQSIRAKYPSVRRIDLMTIIRGPENAACGDPNAYAESTHIPVALDAALTQVAAGSPSLVHVAPQFAVDACADFNGTGPHLTMAGNAKLASEIAAWATVDAQP